MPTLQDVASLAGVSTATVSKVLSNTPYFSDETRDKVLHAVKELGYVPNLAARALSTGKTRIVAVVFPYIYDPIFKDPLVMAILEGIEAEFSRSQYNLLLSTPRLLEDGFDENYDQLIRSGYIDGLIAIDSVPIASAAAPAIQHGIPCVVIGYHQQDFSVHSDDLHGGTLQMQHLLDLGHRNIGIISIPEHLNFATNNRVEGQRRVALAAGLDYDRFPLALGDFSTRSGAEAARQLLTQHPDLTALICLNDRMAMGAIQQLGSMGLRVPADISVVGYDNISTAAIFSPSLTTVNQRASEMGEVAAAMLFEILDGELPVPTILTPQLCVRGSSAAPRVIEKVL